MPIDIDNAQGTRPHRALKGAVIVCVIVGVLIGLVAGIGALKAWADADEPFHSPPANVVPTPSGFEIVKIYECCESVHLSYRSNQPSYDAALRAMIDALQAERWDIELDQAPTFTFEDRVEPEHLEALATRTPYMAGVKNPSLYDPTEADIVVLVLWTDFDAAADYSRTDLGPRIRALAAASAFALLAAGFLAVIWLRSRSSASQPAS